MPETVPATEEASAGVRASYNLIDERWIPVIRDDGTFTRIGLRQSLSQAHEVREVVSEAPTESIALYRLLLALVHRVYGPASHDAWMTLWDSGRFAPALLDAYFSRCEVRDRFDLFDLEHPFGQTPGIVSSIEHSVSRLAHERSSRTDKILFDHRFDVERSPMDAAKAARSILATRLFGVSGQISGEGPTGKGSAAAGPLANVAVSLVRGASLFHTLMLNAVTYCPEEEAPFASEGDAPSWEQDQVTTNRARSPSGYLDWLTYPSRRILLGKPSQVAGSYQVTTATLMEGYRLPVGTHERDIEQMVGFVQFEGKDGPRWGAVRPGPGGLAWRDRLSLMHVTNPAHHHGVLNHLHGLSLLGAEGLPSIIELDVFGFVPDQASPVAWMHERFSFPAAYLGDHYLFEQISGATTFAEDVCNGLIKAVPGKGKFAPTPPWILGFLMAGGEEPKADRIRDILGAENMKKGRTSELERQYWNGLAAAFDRLNVDLPEHGDAALRTWSAQVSQVATAVFASLAERFSGSARGLMSRAKADSAFSHRLHQIRSGYEQGLDGGGT